MANKEPSEAVPYAAPALDKGLDIIELLAGTSQPLSQREIAHHLGRTVGEIYRMVASLVRRNYVRQTGETFILTTKLFELANSNPPTQRLLVEARAIMEALASSLDQSCHLTVWGNGRQVVIAKVDTPSGMGFSVKVGSELDVGVSVSGRVLLAFQDDAIRDRRILEADARQPNPEMPNLLNAIDEIRKRGFESGRSAQVRGLQAVSYPILDGEGHAIAALSVPYAERIDQKASKSFAEAQTALSVAAAELSKRVGGQAPDAISMS